ncbi:MAG: trypsin-like peptidase domain-containing protein [Polyangiaceae bacterium]
MTSARSSSPSLVHGFLALSALASIAACRPRVSPAPDASPRSPAVAATVVSPPPVAPLSSAARTEDERNTISVFRLAAASTVFVTQTRVVYDYLEGTAQEVPAGSGSGFVWDTDGHIVTNYHVVENARALTVTLHDNETVEATVVGTEPRKDIAVLKITGTSKPLVPIHVAKRADLEVGQKTIAIGNPFGLDHTLTTGVVSALGRQMVGVGQVTIRDMIQTDAAINPGNSGGPLLDSNGQLIGMNTMIYSRTGSSAGIGFAVPVSTISRVVPQLVKNGRVEQVGLGINIDPQQRLERRLGLRGVVVLSVPPGGTAEKAGLHGLGRTRRGITLGDVIVAVESDKVDDYDDLYNALDAHKPGETVNVKVKRGDTVSTVPVPIVVIQSGP